MESENKPLLGRLVTIDSEGNETEIMGIAELTPEKLTISADNINLLESGAECSVNIKTITRKRFIKLLMSIKEKLNDIFYNILCNNYDFIISLFVK